MSTDFPTTDDDGRIQVWAVDHPTRGTIGVCAVGVPDITPDGVHTVAAVDLAIPREAITGDGAVRFDAPTARALAAHLTYAADVAEREVDR